MNERDIHPHAETVRGMLAILGPRPRRRLALMLGGLGLSDTEADEVIGYGLARGMFETDPADPDMLRVLPGAPT